MADGFESERTEAYFSGRLRPSPLPRKIRPAKEQEKNKPENSRQNAD